MQVIEVIIDFCHYIENIRWFRYDSILLIDVTGTQVYIIEKKMFIFFFLCTNIVNMTIGCQEINLILNIPKLGNNFTFWQRSISNVDMMKPTNWNYTAVKMTNDLNNWNCQISRTICPIFRTQVIIHMGKNKENTLYHYN